MESIIKYTCLYFRLLDTDLISTFSLKSGTVVFGCFDNRENLLGKVKWPIAWGKYCFIPRIIILDDIYLLEIADFLQLLNQ